VSADPQKPAAVAADAESTRATQADDPTTEAARPAAEARGTELREELAITDERRAEEEQAKAQEAREAAEKEESKREQKRREAEERRRAVADDAGRAREAVADRGATPAPVPAATSAADSGETVAGPDRPELYVAAAFAGAFLFARILKAIAD
jgi:hypothetical protein